MSKGRREIRGNVKNRQQKGQNFQTSEYKICCIGLNHCDKNSSKNNENMLKN